MSPTTPETLSGLLGFALLGFAAITLSGAVIVLVAMNRLGNRISTQSGATIHLAGQIAAFCVVHAKHRDTLHDLVRAQTTTQPAPGTLKLTDLSGWSCCRGPLPDLDEAGAAAEDDSGDVCERVASSCCAQQTPGRIIRDGDDIPLVPGTSIPVGGFRIVPDRMEDPVDKCVPSSLVERAKVLSPQAPGLTTPPGDIASAEAFEQFKSEMLAAREAASPMPRRLGDQVVLANAAGEPCLVDSEAAEQSNEGH